MTNRANFGETFVKLKATKTGALYFVQTVNHLYGIKSPGFCVCCPNLCSKHKCAWKGKFENPKSARFSSVSRELKGVHKVYMPLATRDFKNIILLIFKDKVASTPCVFFRCAKLFSQKNKVSPPPKARFFAGETFNFWKLSCIYTIFFAGKCLSWSKTPIYFFSCAGKFLNHTFSQKNKLSPLPKARDSRRFFRWIFCTTSTFSVELSTVGKLFLHDFQRF